MAKAQRSLLKSGDSLDSIKKSINSFGVSLRAANSTTSAVIKQLNEGNKAKQKSIGNVKSAFLKRREAVRRREREDTLEASKIPAGAQVRASKTISSSTKGFLGRVMDFAGTLMVGWLVNNLPSIINFAKDLIDRVMKVYRFLRDFTGTIFGVFDQLKGALGSIFSTVTGFRTFNKEEMEVKNELARVRSGSMEFEKQIDDGMKSFDQDINWLKAMGLDSDESEKPGDPAPTSSGSADSAGSVDSGGIYAEPDSGTSGGVVSSQQVYKYLRSKNISHIHALGITANILGESDFRIGADEAGDGSMGIGLFQYTFPSRKQAFLQAVPDYKTNWKGQIDFAIGEGSSPQYFSTNFQSAEQAAEWWMNNWERPADSVKAGRRQKHNNFIQTFNTPQADKPATQQPVTPTPGKFSTGNANFDPNKKFAMEARVGDAIKTDFFGSMAAGRTRPHGGADYACPVGTYIACKLKCKVVEVGSTAGYGNYCDIIIPELSIRLRFAHLSSQLIKSGEVAPGIAFARSGNTGRSTGPHIHMEATKNLAGTSYGGDFSPDPYAAMMIFSKNPPSASSTNTTSGGGLLDNLKGMLGFGGPSLQPISKDGVYEGITPETRDKTVTVPMPSSPGGSTSAPAVASGSPPPEIPTLSMTDMLNNKRKQELLSQLAYV